MHSTHESARSPVSISSLSLVRQGLHSVPAELSEEKDPRFIRLKRLNLSDNLLSSFCFPIAHMYKLETLNLAKNQFRELPLLLAQSFAQLTRLRELDISHNQLSTLPAQLMLLTGLTRLEASYNRLLSPPRSRSNSIVTKHDNTDTICKDQEGKGEGEEGEGEEDEDEKEENYDDNASRQLLSSLDFGQLAGLEYLCISHNLPSKKTGYPQGFHRFPPTLLSLSRLTSLKLHGNNLELPPGFFGAFESLTDLDIGGNRSDNSPSRLESLRLTSLNIDGLDELYPQVFQVV